MIRYHQLFETIHIGILILNYKTRVIEAVNPYLENLSGYSSRELVGRKISETKIFDDELSGLQIFNGLKKHDEILYDDVPLFTKSGDKKIVELGAHIFSTDGKTLVQCAIRDLTEKRKAQKELFETGQRLEALMNSLPVGVAFSLDRKVENVRGNPYLLKKMEIRPEDNISVTTKDKQALGRKLRHYRNGVEIKPKDMPMQQAIAKNREVGPYEIEVELPSGKRWLVDASAAPVRDRDGTVVGAVAVNVDLTERKRAEEAERLSQVVRQEKLKMDFIADAAHELRTPLAIIKGNADLALHKKADADEALKAINTEVSHLTNLITDLSLLTAQEGEARRKVLTKEVNLKALVENIVKRHRNFAEKKNISLHLTRLPEARITGDEYYLERLFSNILSNAVSYGKESGEIWVSGEKDPRQIHIYIKDNGMGISEKDLPHIFERFYRAEASRSKDYGGSGLGLAIVKWIAEAHGGTVTAVSTEGKGSLFTISLPLSKNQEKNHKRSTQNKKL